MEFYEVAVSGVPLLFVVIGVVEWLKKMGVQGKAALASSMGVGLLFGFGFQAAASGFPIDFTGWFSYIVYGLGLGIVASGLYDAWKTK